MITGVYFLLLTVSIKEFCITMKVMSTYVFLQEFVRLLFFDFFFREKVFPFYFGETKQSSGNTRLSSAYSSALTKAQREAQAKEHLNALLQCHYLKM